MSFCVCNVTFLLYSKDKKMALTQMGSIEEAVKALIVSPVIFI